MQACVGARVHAPTHGANALQSPRRTADRFRVKVEHLHSSSEFQAVGSSVQPTHRAHPQTLLEIFFVSVNRVSKSLLDSVKSIFGKRNNMLPGAHSIILINRKCSSYVNPHFEMSPFIVLTSNTSPRSTRGKISNFGTFVRPSARLYNYNNFDHKQIKTSSRLCVNGRVVSLFCFAPV